MKQFLYSMLMLLLLMPLIQQQCVAGDQKSPTIISDTCQNSSIDSGYYYTGNDFDYFGIYFSADSIFAADVYVDYQNGTNNKWVTYTDSVIVSSTNGGAKFINMRAPSAFTFPWAANYLRLRVSKRASGNGGVGKYYKAIISGIKIRSE